MVVFFLLYLDVFLVSKCYKYAQQPYSKSPDLCCNSLCFPEHRIRLKRSSNTFLAADVRRWCRLCLCSPRAAQDHIQTGKSTTWAVCWGSSSSPCPKPAHLNLPPKLGTKIQPAELAATSYLAQQTHYTILALTEFSLNSAQTQSPGWSPKSMPAKRSFSALNFTSNPFALCFWGANDK